MDVLEVTDAVTGASHLTQTVIQHVSLVLVLALLDQCFQILTRHISVIIDQTHHILSELYHVTAFVL